MARNTKEIPLDKLLTIKLKPVADYIGAFGTEKQDNLLIERLALPTPDKIKLLQSALLADKDLQSLIAEIKKPVADSDKGQVLQVIKDFFNNHPFIIISLKDNQGTFQPAILIWYKQTDYSTAEIKNLDRKTGFTRLIAVNKNLDKSFGAQAEIPRIKLSAGINTLLNYQIFKSCEKFGQLLSTDLLYINNLIDSPKNLFDGSPIQNRGQYDNKDQYEALFPDGAKKTKKQSAADSNTTDLYQ